MEKTNNKAKYPCRSCIYCKICGNTNRKEVCHGRMTKTEKKIEEKNNRK